MLDKMEVMRGADVVDVLGKICGWPVKVAILVEHRRRSICPLLFSCAARFFDHLLEHLIPLLLFPLRHLLPFPHFLSNSCQVVFRHVL